jgi:hypothetical protein
MFLDVQQNCRPISIFARNSDMARIIRNDPETEHQKSPVELPSLTYIDDGAKVNQMLNPQ